MNYLIMGLGGTSHSNGYFNATLIVKNPLQVKSITPNRTSPTNASNITYTVVFSEAVTGFAASDVTVASGNTPTVSGSGKTWTVVVPTTDNQEYTETITIKANGAAKTSGGTKVSKAKTSTGIVVDRIDPTAGTLTMKLNDASGNDYTNNTWTNQNVYIALNNGSDTGSGHDTTTYSLNSGEATTSAQTISTEGTNTVIVTTKDKAGNTATRTYTIKIDKTLPTAGTLTMKLNDENGEDYTNDTWTNQNVYIALNNGSDTESGHASTTYSLDGGTATTSSQIITTEGIHTVVVTTEDAVGNTATRTYTIKIDKTDPIAGTVTMKLNDASGSDYTSGALTDQNVYIVINDGSDDLSGHKLTKCTILKNGVEYLTNQVSSLTLSETGEYSIMVITTDNAENTATRSEYTVQIDKDRGGLPIDLGNGTIKPIYRPEWEKVSSSINIVESNLENSTISIVLRGNANHRETIDDNVEIDYSSTVTGDLTTDDITVYINETEASWIRKSLTPPADTTDVDTVTYTLTLSGFEENERQLGVPYKEWSGNIKLKIAGRGEDSSTYNEDVLVDKYGNQNMMETDEDQTDGTWIDVTYQDTETNQNTDGTMFADFVKPEFTYKYSDTTIVGGDIEKVTVVFDVTDQYFASSLLTADLITVEVADEEVNSTVNVTKTLTKIKDVYYDKTAGTNYVDTGATGTGKKVGERYQLEITGLDKGDAFKYSGYMTLQFLAGVKDATTGTLTSGAIDNSGNLNPGTTITIGLDDTDGNPGADEAGDGTVVDVVDPIWKVSNIEINENLSNLKNSTVTLELTATDKYYLSNVFEEARAAEATGTTGALDEALRNNILLSIDGQLDGDTDGDGILEEGETPTITKTLSTATELTPAGTGVKYTLTLSNWDAEKYSGTARIKIPAGTITDQIVDGRNNASNEQEFIIGHIDFTKPVITKVSSENIDSDSDGEDDAQKIIFKATDKFMVMDDLITIPDATNPSAADEITVYVDNEVATGITRTLTSEEITEVVNGVTVKGHQYTLIISNFEQVRTTINRDREFSDWSGTVRIDIAEGAVRDEEVTLDNGEVAGGNVNDLTPITGEFADFIKPNVTYEYSSTDIVRNHANKAQRTFTMVFDVTDKYFTSSAFEAAFAASTTDAQKLAVLQEYLTIWIDDVNITNVDTVTKKIVEISNVTATMNKTTDIANKTITNNATNQVIGKRFTLEISNLEQDANTALGNDFLNYSGVITVGFNASKPLATDESGNSNVAGSIIAPSITSGVTTPDGSGSEVIVDLVDPLWEQSDTAEARPYDKYAKIPIKGTDKYIQTNNLQESDITITVTTPAGTTVVNGAEASTQGMTLTVEEDTETVLTYGKQYIIELNGYSSDAYQVKLTLRDGILVDTSGNTSQETSFILFTSLAETSTETLPTSEFLAQNKEDGQVIPQRQYVEQVIFQNDLDGMNETKWDVSQLNDGTIWAWYTTRTATDATSGDEVTLYTVYIGSYIIMNGNVNSSYLFANLGYNANCKVTGDTTDNEFIENLYILQLSSVTNMSHMFDGCGYANMQSLDLGTAFNTMSVTDMSYMFQNCGYTSMTSLDLGDKFNTSKVTNMSNMFNGCGQQLMTTLTIGTDVNKINFNTSLVTNMSAMFQNFGSGKLASLTLGDNFNTSAVTDMNNMFNGCGKSEMTALTLGNNFNTAKVQNMSGMFQDFGQTKTTTLDLGNLFYTTSATNMSNMFNGCGTTAMTILDLGPVFTQIASTNTDFSTSCGKSSTVIYAPESIYSNMKKFKLNTTSTTTITLDSSTQGTIKPIYKPEWEKVSSSLNTSTGVMTVVVKGFADINTTIGSHTMRYTSDVTSTISSSDITVYVDGELAQGIDASDITVSTATPSINPYTGKTEVQHTITITNFEQSLRLGGKNFKEWSGNVSLQFAKGTLIDTYGSYIGEDASGNDIVVVDVSKDADGNIVGNQNLAIIDIDTSGTIKNILVEETTKLTANTETTEANMFADLIKPEYTYSYSSTNPDINTGNESVTVVFDVTDKYFESTALASDGDGNLITVIVDEDENANTPITKVLTKIKDIYYDATAGITYVDSGVAGTGRKVGERYQLVITGLDREDGFSYSGPMTLEFDAGAEDASGNLTAGVRDNSGNLSDLTAITMGINEPGTGGGSGTYVSASTIFDADGTNADGLHIGDFVNYDAGTWTAEEISSIQTGLKTSLVTANGSTNKPSSEFQFGGFIAGSSRNENATPNSSEYNYIKDKSTGEALTGWRVFDIDDDGTITLISSGSPEDYRMTGYTSIIYANEYILTGNVNSNWNQEEANNYQKREWSAYINTLQKATNAKILTYDCLESWLEKYVGNFGTLNNVKKLYEEPYLKYQNIVDIYSDYFLNRLNSSADTMDYFWTPYRMIANTKASSLGVRVLVTLSPEALFTEQKIGTKTVTGGNMDTYGGDQTYNVWGLQSTEEIIIVDVVDPVWEVQNAAGEIGKVDKTVDANGNVSATMTLIGKDKYFKQSTLTKDDIKIKVDEVEDITSTAPDLVKTLSAAQYIKLDESGNYVVTENEEEAIGVKYTFSISGFKETDNTFFTNRANYNDNDESTAGRPYREYSGEMTIVIPAGKLEDETGNTNNKFEIDLEHVDTLKPEVIKVSSQSNLNATNSELSTHTIVFDIVDKYINSSSITATDTSMIHVYLDGEEAASITKPATEEEQNANTDKIFKEITNIQPLTETVNGASRTVGYRYTLVLSGIEKPRTSINYDREYTDWSGDLSIKIDANTARDTSNTGNDETILYGNEAETTDKTKADHVDYVKPDATYEYNSVQDGVSDVTDKDGKTYTMVFDVTDKFFQTEDTNANGELDEGEDTNSNGVLDDGDGLSIADFSILMSAEEETGEGEDGYYDLMANALIGKALESEDITNQVVVDVVNGVEVKETRVIGKRYTLRISNLEKLQRIENNYYLDYSGSITITIPAGKITDTSGNGNDTTSIITGIDIPGGEVTDIELIDVVQPLWERTAFTTDIHAKTATITLLGTDKYFYEYDLEPEDEGYDADLANNGTLTLEEIKLYINGIETTGTISEGTKTLTDAEGNIIGKLSIASETKLYEERLVQTEYSDGDVDAGYSTETVQYGVQYVLNLTDLAVTANQIKIHLPEGSLVDQSANPNRVTEFLVYNTLKTATDTNGDWESDPTSGFLGNASIQRQNIEKVEFVDSLDAAPTIGTESAEGVILCWDVSAQRDNSILAWATQTATQATNGLYTVYIGSNDDIYGNIDSSYLFACIGLNENEDVTITATDTISGINLLDTRNVTNMSYMFAFTGANAMTDLNLGANFDTSNVTDMTNMFWLTGAMSMTNLNLGEKFDTSNVTNMSSMFFATGGMALTSLDLGDNFDTSNVENMSSMFEQLAIMSTGFTTLDLGATGVTFNTEKVTDMSKMFKECGQAGLTTFNLGSNFNTSSVQDMSGMFQGFAYNLETLNLGSNFHTTAVIDMSNMFYGCGQTAMTTLNLGDNFNTSAVEDMSGMFTEFAKSSTTMTSLDLKDKFYTTTATDMTNMFNGCGQTAMTTLDLGPAFTKIANTNGSMLINCGKSGAIIFAPESIYNDRTHFKLNTDSATKIEYTVGTINPVYKPEWEKVSSTIDTTNKEITITFKGYANETFTNGTYTGDYLSTITSSITAGNDASNLLKVKVDGEIAEEITQTVTAISVTGNEVQYTIKLSGFEEEIRQTAKNKNFLEWSGNIAVQPVKGTLIDIYGNKNMISIDDADGNWLDIELRDAAQDGATGNWIDDTTTTDVAELEDNNADASTNGIMFTDFIKPEYTYVYSASNPNIEGDPNNRVTIVFDVTDKYFKNTSISVGEDLDSDGELDEGEDINGNGVLDADNITVIVDSDEDANTAITKTLTKVNDLYYTVNGVTTHKVGERYQLVIDGLESSNGVGYSGPLTLSFPQDVITDLSGNKSDQAAITMGVNEPDGDPDDEIIVDVVNPVWSYADSEIDRTNKQVNIYIIGSDKYYYTDVFKAYITDMADGTLDDTTLLDDIIVHVDNSSTTVDTDRDGTPDANVSGITKTLTDITDEMKAAGNEARLAELIAGAGLTDKMTADNNLTKVGVIYKLTLSTFGTISGNTKVVINPNTIEDASGNKNTITTINVGNVSWVEDNEPLETTDPDYPRYDAFRGNVVDFIKPVITYEYSTVMVDTNGDGTADSTVSANPDIDYDQKEVTVKFKVTDKYLLGSDLIKTTTDAGGNTIQVPKNISITVDGTKVYDGNLETQPYEVTATISETAIANGKEYTLVISNLQQTNTSQPADTTPENGDGFKFSGPMTIDFVGGVIDDTSGNKNAGTSITLDTHVNPDVVDVVDPIIYKATSSIDRGAKTVTVNLIAKDKYLKQQVLTANQNSVKVRVEDEYGNIIVEDTTTIRKNITQTFFNTNDGQANFSVVLDNFGVYEGKTTIIIPENMIIDTSGNGNIETEILVGSASDSTAFKDHIVDFTKPTWEYVVSSIERDFDVVDRRLENGELGTNNPDGTVTIEVKGTDIYFDKPTYFDNATNQLNLNNVVVYVNGVAKDDIDVAYATNPDDSIVKEYIEETKELATGYSRVFKGVKYKLILSNFGTYDGQVQIDIPVDAIKDTSENGNIVTPIDVGNEKWLETDVDGADDDEDTTPAIDENLSRTDVKYPAFRNDYVDFIKPVITYKYEANENPKLIRTTDGEGNPIEKVEIQFTATDTNFLESNIGLEDIKVFIDDDYEMQVYGTGANAATAITAELDYDDLPEEDGNGIIYTLTLSGLELNQYINSEMFERHSGRVKLVIAADQVYDTSGNPNNETTIIVDNDDGDDASNIQVVDFVSPNIYYKDKYINWNDRYAVVTLRATDRYFDDEDSSLEPSDIALYENGTQITDFAGKIQINKTPLTDAFGNMLGYDYIIRLNEFTEEFKLEVRIPGMKLYDTSDNYNEPTNIFVDLDNRKPTWEYVSTDTSGFEPENGGTISFNVKGVDKYLDLTNSNLEVADIKVLLDSEELLDGADATDATKITVTHLSTDETEKSKSYKIDVTGLTEVGVYTLVLADGTLIDTFNNESAATTITFSKAVIAPNTGNYTNVTYHISPDHETVHSSYVHELMSVNTTGTNSGSTTYRPSTLGELYNNGANPLFKEPMYKPTVGADGYTISYTYSPVSFAGWAEADSYGNPIYYTDASLTTISTTQTAYTRVYGLYDEIPNTVTNLKAVWQDATIVFVSSESGDNTNDGKLPTTPVQDLQTAYTKINPSGTAENNIIVIMDLLEFNSTATLTGNATITSLYAGVDYRTLNANPAFGFNALLLLASEAMNVNGDVIFDNILMATEQTILVSNYSGDITMGRNVTTPEFAEGMAAFAGIIGGNYGVETSTGELGTHTIRVEAGTYQMIIGGSIVEEPTAATKSVTHNVVIGNMRDAAISRNDKLLIGALIVGGSEQNYYPSGATTTQTAANKTYANVTLYSGTVVGMEGLALVLRSEGGTTDGKMNFEMYGGQVTGNIYAGASSTTYTGETFNILKFYGGQLTGDIFGQDGELTFKGGSDITLQGNFSMTGNIYGGSGVTNTVEDSTVLGTGSSKITIDSASVTVTGNIYGGSKSTAGYMEGNTEIILNNGTVTNIYGGGYGSGVQGTTNITIDNGLVTGNVFGGGYQGEARTISNITVLGGTVGGNIYGGNDNSDITKDTVSQDINITIGDMDATKAPTITGNIYGSGQKDNVDKVIIQLIESADTTTVYGGSDENAVTTTVDIYLKGMTVDNIYGGGQSAGTVETANIYLQAGTATDVYGGGYAADVETSNITLEGITIETEVEGEIVSEDLTATVGTIYGGSNTGGTVTTSNVTLKSGNLTNVFGGGNSAASVGTANVTLDGITINTIHGGSKDAGVATKTNVTLSSGTVENVFGGGLDVGAGETNVSHQGSAVVTNIYGGNNSGSGTGGETTTSNVKISSNVTNVYGGNYLKGTTTNTNVIIHGSPTISGKLFAGGYKSNIGKVDSTGSTTIKVVGGTINNDINGGSEEGIVYGTTNMYIGVDSFIDPTLTAGNVEIKGTIYGAGSATTSGYTTLSVVGNTHITMDNSSVYPITYSGSIFGSGKNSTYSTSGTASDESTINLKDFGTSVDNTHQLISIERTGNLYIGKSFIELTGRQDEYNYYKRKSYTLNRITNGLTIYDNTTLFNRRGYNMVGGFNSYQTLGGTKATMMNVQNRLYTFEGINLIFAKQEGDIYANPTQDIWGDVNGMTFFGMYAIDRDDPTKKVLDIYAPDFDGDAVKDFFANGTYVEGRHKTPSHSLTADGFYTNIADYTDLSNITVTQQVIDATDYGTYYDWIVGAEIVNYETTLIGSTYGKESISEVLLDYQYDKGATYTLNRVSLNPLNTGVNLVKSDSIPTISTNANNTFGLTMETDRTGWLSSSLANIYTASDGSFDGYDGDDDDEIITYASDTSAGAGKIIFRLQNSINITEKKDLGNVDLILTGKTPEGEDGTGANTFIVVIAVNIQTIVDQIGNKYEPSFTDKVETELSYTTDSKVDLSYLLYNTVNETPYADGDYRVISSTVRFPEGTKITLKDYGQGDSLNKVYYYHVPSTTPVTETKDGVTRYIYKLSDFIDMGSKTSKYADNNTTYYHSADGYVLEKYDISIDFIDSNIAQTLANETYLELRNSSGTIKYDNGTTISAETRIKYNLYLYSSTDPIYRAQFAETISNQGQSYSVVESLEIPFTITASLLEQNGIMDTKYYDQIVGIAVQIVGESGVRIKSPELQNFKLTNLDSGKVFEADENGVIRMPIIEGFGSLSANYSLSLEQSNVAPGVYTAQVRLFAADDGKYYGTEPAVEQTFSITFISKLAGLIGAEATDDSRIINATTGLNLEEGNTANKAVDMTVGVANPSNETNIRVELYKRNPTYTNIADEESYTGTSYTLVDIAQYLKDTSASEDTNATDASEDALDTWVTPSTYGFTAANQYEYMVMNKKTYSTPLDIITIEFEKAIMSGIDTGEYKLVFKAYSDDTLVQTVKKTFIVTP